MPEYKVTFESAIQIEAIDEKSAIECAHNLAKKGDIGQKFTFTVEEIGDKKDETAGAETPPPAAPLVKHPTRWR